MGRKKSVILIGVGGVGKTTLIWRLIGLSLTPAATRRPGVYRLFYEDKLYEIVDVPGQAAAEVARAVASTPTLFFRPRSAGLRLDEGGYSLRLV